MTTPFLLKTDCPKPSSIKKNYEKIILLIFVLLFTTISSLKARVGINTDDLDAISYLDISGIEKGLLPPRLTNDERNDLDYRGLIFYNITEEEFRLIKELKTSLIGLLWVTVVQPQLQQLKKNGFIFL